MTSPWQYALTVGPLGFYLWVLALWQTDRHPRVVGGVLDFGMLAFGVGGLLAFGPFGQFLTRLLSPRPGLYEQLMVVSGLGLWVIILSRRAARRLVVYHVDAERFLPALTDALNRTGEKFKKTMGGFEDLTSSRGLTVQFTRWLGCATVEAHGVDAEKLIREVEPLLDQRLRRETTRKSPIALGLYGASILVMLAPMIGLVLTRPRARAALRVWLERLKGG